MNNHVGIPVVDYYIGMTQLAAKQQAAAEKQEAITLKNEWLANNSESYTNEITQIRDLTSKIEELNVRKSDFLENSALVNNGYLRAAFVVFGLAVIAFAVIAVNALSYGIALVAVAGAFSTLTGMFPTMWAPSENQEQERLQALLNQMQLELDVDMTQVNELVDHRSLDKERNPEQLIDPVSSLDE